MPKKEEFADSKLSSITMRAASLLSQAGADAQATRKILDEAIRRLRALRRRN